MIGRGGRRQAIRTLVKDHRYDYIETGSLLSIKKNTKDIRIPSEEARLTLYPMDYEEFRWAMGDTLSCTMLREAFARQQPLGNASMQKLMRDFRIYQKLINNKLSADLGYLYENMVAQMLTAAGNELYYHTWPTERSKHNYEIDFLLSRGKKLSPIEVKSSSYRRHISLDTFCSKYSDRVGTPYIIYSKDLVKEQNVMFVPIFMTGFL